MRWIGEREGETAGFEVGEPGYELFAAHSPGARPRSCQTFLDTGRAVSVAALVGVLVGSVVAALELNPAFNYNTWLYMSFATGSLGVWAIASVFVADHSVSPRQAALRTLFFMAFVALTYFTVRYVNYLGEQSRLLQSMSEVMDGRFSAMERTPFWTPEKWVALGLSLALSGLAAFVAWGIRRFAASPLYWVFAWAPLFVLVFEGWSYFVPMALYVQVGFVPAVVDVVGAVAVAWMLVSDRNRALAERIA